MIASLENSRGLAALS